MVDGRQLKHTAPALHLTLPFCIGPCSMELVGSVGLVEHGFVPESGDDEG